MARCSRREAEVISTERSSCEKRRGASKNMTLSPREHARRFVRVHATSWWARRELEEISEAAGRAEELIRDEVAAISRRWSDAEGTMKPEDLEAYGEHLADEGCALEDVFGQTFRRALFVSSYAAVEQHLTRLTEAARELFGLALDPDTLKDRGIRRAETYLTSVAGVRFPSDAEEWTLMQQFGDLRNHLVHIGPWLDPKLKLSRRVTAYFRGKPLISVEPGHAVLLERGFVEDSVATASRLCASVLQSIRVRWDAQR